jgi:hypothetical protein
MSPNLSLRVPIVVCILVTGTWVLMGTLLLAAPCGFGLTFSRLPLSLLSLILLWVPPNAEPGHQFRKVNAVSVPITLWTPTPPAGYIPNEADLN